MKKIINEEIPICGNIEGIKFDRYKNDSLDNKSRSNKIKNNMKKVNLKNKFDRISLKQGNINLKIINLLRYNSLIIVFTIFLNLFIQVLPVINTYLLKSNSNKIELKLKGTGNVYILGPDFNNSYYPNMVYINGYLINPVNYSYYFEQIDNYVELIWNYSINYCKYMFFKCSDITEIDLSEFDSSEITNMDYMFRDCISLTKINFTNFVTSNVQEMYDMFRNCSSLTSLDLSNFRTSKVRYI